MDQNHPSPDFRASSASQNRHMSLQNTAQRLLWPLAILGGGAVLWAIRHRAPAAFWVFFMQLREIALLPVCLGILSIYVCFALRAIRWALLLQPAHKADWKKLISPQLIGFTAVALFGRVADLTRPYLVARRLRTPVATQVAVYSIERMFDLGAAAILFSCTLALGSRNIPHHEAYARAGALSLFATAIVAALASGIRLAGAELAQRIAELLRPLSLTLARAASSRVVALQQGFGTLVSFGQFARALALSLLMWLGIAFAYLASAHAFRSTPELAGLTYAGIMLLLATSLGASLLQLPVLGWFTQVAALAAAFHAFYNVPLETASACGAVTLFVTTLCVIPGGLIAAQLQGESLRESARAAA